MILLIILHIKVLRQTCQKNIIRVIYEIFYIGMFSHEILGVQISSVRSFVHLFQNKMNEQIN